MLRKHKVVGKIRKTYLFTFGFTSNHSNTLQFRFHFLFKSLRNQLQVATCKCSCYTKINAVIDWLCLEIITVMNRIVKTTNCQRNCTIKKSIKLKCFNISVRLSVSDAIKNIFTFPGVQNSTTVRNLKINIELFSGIPYYLQRLHYLDDGQ